MGYFYCAHCDSVYTEKSMYCPNELCHRKLFEIDENMIVPIRILNKKGYKTSYCCSGHIFAGFFGGYIAFSPDTVLPVQPPKGWKYDKAPLEESRCKCIRYNFKGCKNEIDRTKMIFSKTLSLIKWCEELPEYDDSPSGWVQHVKRE